MMDRAFYSHVRFVCIFSSDKTYQHDSLCTLKKHTTFLRPQSQPPSPSREMSRNPWLAYEMSRYPASMPATPRGTDHEFYKASTSFANKVGMSTCVGDFQYSKSLVVFFPYLKMLLI